MKTLLSVLCSISFTVLSCISLTVSAAPGPQQNFPHLGMWWPDPATQPLSDIARYDFITLFNYQSSYVAPLKAINPQQLILNSTNACELSYDDFSELYQDMNIAEIPAEWFLTQVGSTLSTAINRITTRIQVASLIV